MSDELMITLAPTTRDVGPLLKAIVNAMREMGGGTVNLPEGTIRVGETIVADSMVDLVAKKKRKRG